jgi:hypothetical protein
MKLGRTSPKFTKLAESSRITWIKQHCLDKPNICFRVGCVALLACLLAVSFLKVECLIKGPGEC